MKDEEFKQKLSEVAEWRLPKLSNSEIKIAKQKARGKGRPTNEELYQDEHEEIFLEIFQGINPTYSPELVKVKIQSCVCEDCGDHCAEGRKKEKKLYETGDKRNWRERCLTCERSKNPFTGKFDMTNAQAPHVWTDFLKNRKGAYNTTKIQAIKESTVIITKYPETMREN
jgi:hypothetical protein